MVMADFSDLDHIRFKWIFLSDINVVWVTNLLRHICLIQACSTKVVFNSPKYVLQKTLGIGGFVFDF